MLALQRTVHLQIAPHLTQPAKRGHCGTEYKLRLRVVEVGCRSCRRFVITVASNATWCSDEIPEAQATPGAAPPPAGRTNTPSHRGNAPGSPAQPWPATCVIVDCSTKKMCHRSQIKLPVCSTLTSDSKGAAKIHAGVFGPKDYVIKGLWKCRR